MKSTFVDVGAAVLMGALLAFGLTGRVEFAPATLKWSVLALFALDAAVMCGLSFATDAARRAMAESRVFVVMRMLGTAGQIGEAFSATIRYLVLWMFSLILMYSVVDRLPMLVLGMIISTTFVALLRSGLDSVLLFRIWRIQRRGVSEIEP